MSLHRKVVVLTLALLWLSASAEAEVSPALVEAADRFRELWRVHARKSGPADLSGTLAALKAKLRTAPDLSAEARTVLMGITLEPGPNPAYQIGDEIRCPALAVLYDIQLLGLTKLPPPWVSANYERMGRASRHIEYGKFQLSYDSLLVTTRCDHDLWTTAPGPPNVKLGPLAGRPSWRLDRLRAITESTGDWEWEAKVLRWRFGAISATEFLSSETAPVWARLAVLQPGVAGELNGFMALVAGAPREEVPWPPEHLSGTRDPRAPTREELAEVVKLMCDMRMPWEAYHYLRHIEKAWATDVSDELARVNRRWKEDYADLAAARAKAPWLRRWYVASVRVVAGMTLEEFAEEAVSRPNLPGDEPEPPTPGPVPPEPGGTSALTIGVLIGGLAVLAGAVAIAARVVYRRRRS